MVMYRRQRIPGGTYFFTLTLQVRSSHLLTEHVDALRQSFRQVRQERPFVIDAIVVLPDHLHTLITLPNKDSDYPGRWLAIKSSFTRNLVARGVALTRNRRGEYALWQRRYWEHAIRDEEDFRALADYIHFNPVKHGWAERVRDWPLSLIHI